MSEDGEDRKESRRAYMRGLMAAKRQRERQERERERQVLAEIETF